MTCFPLTHSWSAWKDIGSTEKGKMLMQEKRCQRCNKAVRRQTNWLGGDVDLSGDEILP